MMEPEKDKDESSKKSTEFAVIIPAFNEEETIINTIKETARVLDSFNTDYEILVIDDGSLDSTYIKVCDFLRADNRKIKIQRYDKNMGKGFALKYGFDFVNSRYVVFLDADLDLHPSNVTGMYSIMQERDADAVIGSKKHKNSELNYPKSRKILSNAYYFIVRTLFRLPVRDTQTGIKLFKYKALKDCMQKVSIKRYAFDLELLLSIYSKGYRIVEAPIQLKTKREFGRIGIMDAFVVFSDTVKIFWRFYIKKDYR